MDRIQDYESWDIVSITIVGANLYGVVSIAVVREFVALQGRVQVSDVPPREYRITASISVFQTDGAGAAPAICSKRNGQSLLIYYKLKAIYLEI